MVRRLVLALTLVALAAVPATAGKRKGKARAQTSSLAEKKRTKMKVCSVREVKKGKRTRRKRVCTYHAMYEGRSVKSTELRADPLDRPSGDVWVRSENLQEEVKVHLYDADGRFDDAALAQLDEIFRCKRTNTVRAVDPRLYEQLSRIQDHFGGVRIEIVSGFRNQEDKASRHFHASAMDIKVKDHSIDEVYAYAQTLDPGGMGIGIYPHSGFVHVDFRAPGERSTRWTDWSYPSSDGKANAKHPTRPRKTKAHRPNS